MATNQTSCSFCGDPLIEEEAESPRLDPNDDKPVCDDCYHDHFEFTCCFCDEYGDVEDQHNLLVVFEPVSSMGGPNREVTPGIYRIKGERAYHGGPIIGEGWLYGDQLERIADVPPDMDGDGYPCGHLCLDCQNDAIARAEPDAKER